MTKDKSIQRRANRLVRDRRTGGDAIEILCDEFGIDEFVADEFDWKARSYLGQYGFSTLWPCDEEGDAL